MTFLQRSQLLLNTFFFLQNKLIHRYTWTNENDRSLMNYIAVGNKLVQNKFYSDSSQKSVWMGLIQVIF